MEEASQMQKGLADSCESVSAIHVKRRLLMRKKYGWNVRSVDRSKHIVEM